MEWFEEKHGNYLVLNLCGRLDSVTSRMVEEKVTALIEQGERYLMVDCAQLVYISSAGLRVFLMAAKRISQVKGQITLSSLNEDVQQVFDLTGFSSILQIYRTREEALINSL